MQDTRFEEAIIRSMTGKNKGIKINDWRTAVRYLEAGAFIEQCDRSKWNPLRYIKGPYYWRTV